MNSPSGRAGLIKARDEAGSMEKLAHSVLDDILHNVISDILTKVHREEKQAKATSAAIRVEKMASDASESSTPDSKPDGRVETDAAIYEDGRVTLKGNPLQTTPDILCPKCHLPRLLAPTDGKGAVKPDPTIIYCKRHPYIDKPGCDIYGQSWVAPGPGRGKKKKDMEKPDPADKPANVLSFPSATCSKCKRCILVTRLNNHMGSCIGNSGRNASRAAAQKMNGNGSQHDSTPPSSQKATPGPGSRASSPRKRDVANSEDDDDDDDDSDASPKKKKVKSVTAAAAGVTKKVILKTKPNMKPDKARVSSHLKQEHKFDESDSAHDKTPTKALNKHTSPLKKVKVQKPTSSPLSRNGRDIDMRSESSDAMSSPPGR
ncbi:transcriptional activator [Cordyceps militaris]|uniref:Transcriptional activator n=1 Tax=Cordyceps militaris TaxID=73501 RepID=A0A2H4SB82_CORMI|nr:transcriptional activator [Cordyceps militaris]